MIAKEFEEFILREEKTFLTPARNLAVLIDTHMWIMPSWC